MSFQCLLLLQNRHHFLKAYSKTTGLPRRKVQQGPFCKKKKMSEEKRAPSGNKELQTKQEYTRSWGKWRSGMKKAEGYERENNSNKTKYVHYFHSTTIWTHLTGSSEQRGEKLCAHLKRKQEQIIRPMQSGLSGWQKAIILHTKTACWR